MEDEILNEIRTFVYDGGWGYTLPFPFLFKKKEINRDTKLVVDLKITGDDADDFFIAFAEKFNVDISGFKIGDYFGNEEDFVASLIKDLFRNKEKGRKSLNIGHLEKAVIVGRLDEDVINS
ncbi:DUF1493 family protein [Sphingobacterium siyangense]|uniref:DUF1493 family protein n=1 Tax=Sphingobacterium siyangense TaxID=459529 RepID=UPI0019669151|nr:DUF1493 family protein [Sphingobacterium siyangense]QRY60488.1 DUF1493 family protein [Sphingobacterium siyangense]